MLGADKHKPKLIQHPGAPSWIPAFAGMTTGIEMAERRE